MVRVPDFRQEGGQWFGTDTDKESKLGQFRSHFIA